VSEQLTPAAPELNQTTITTARSGPNFLLRVVWYLLIGWWLTGISLAVGYLAGLTVIGLPIAFWVFNRTGTILTLRPRTKTTTTVESGGVTTVTREHRKQRSLLLRAIYFVLIGWWAALIWMIVSYLISLTIIGIPVGIMMLNRLPEIYTLHRN
jgi:uncharacterized membrane protein YccF (DUF307 family)